MNVTVDSNSTDNGAERTSWFATLSVLRRWSFNFGPPNWTSWHDRDGRTSVDLVVYLRIGSTCWLWWTCRLLCGRFIACSMAIRLSLVGTLKQTDIYSVGVTGSFYSGWKHLAKAENSYSEIVGMSSIGYRRSDITTDSSMKLYSSFFDQSSEISLVGSLFLLEGVFSCSTLIFLCCIPSTS